MASQTITEVYLADFRLVWRGLLAHLQNVLDNAWMLASVSPDVVVDAARTATLLDAVIEVLHSQSAHRCVCCPHWLH